MRISDSVRALLESEAIRAHGIPHEIGDAKLVSDKVVIIKGLIYRQWVYVYRLEGYSRVHNAVYTDLPAYVIWRRLLKQGNEDELRKSGQTYTEEDFKSFVYKVVFRMVGVFNLDESDMLLYVSPRWAGDLVRNQGYTRGSPADLEMAKAAMFDEIAAGHAAAIDTVWAAREATEATIRRQRQIDAQEM